MNRQGNAYTIVYSAVMVIVVAAVLAIAAVALKPYQQENIRVDKMKQILSAVNIAATQDDAAALYEQYITDSYVLNAAGEKTSGVAFEVDAATEVKRPAEERLLPVFECTLAGGEVKYILPLYGAGLWGPIWGYLSVDADGKTVYGAYFAHQGETPGLGAEIEGAAFQSQFAGKRLFKDGDFKPVAVMKVGQKPIDGADYVDAVSGGTITSKGVQDMIQHCLLPYETFLKQIAQ